jgi:hypothetical protein
LSRQRFDPLRLAAWELRDRGGEQRKENAMGAIADLADGPRAIEMGSFDCRDRLKELSSAGPQRTDRFETSIRNGKRL